MSEKRSSDSWVTVTWVLVGLVGALAVAVTVLAVRLAAVSSHADKIASCINDNLSIRSAPAQADAAAHIAWAQAVLALFLPQTATPQQRAHEAQVFKHATRVYVHVLVADQATRNANPLGRC